MAMTSLVSLGVQWHRALDLYCLRIYRILPLRSLSRSHPASGQLILNRSTAHPSVAPSPRESVRAVDPLLDAWRGMATFAQTEEFSRVGVTKAEYEEWGGERMRRWWGGILVFCCRNWLLSVQLCCEKVLRIARAENARWRTPAFYLDTCRCHGSSESSAAGTCTGTSWMHQVQHRRRKSAIHAEKSLAACLLHNCFL